MAPVLQWLLTLPQQELHDLIEMYKMRPKKTWFSSAQRWLLNLLPSSNSEVPEMDDEKIGPLLVPNRTGMFSEKKNGDSARSCLVRAYPWELSYFPQISYNIILPRSHFVDVPHIRQLCSWDCGLACVLMVLRTLGIDHCDIHSLGKLCCTTSIWTVDLAHLLHKFSVGFYFLTVTLGVNPDFSVESFYKEHLPDDLRRVDGLFKQALEAGFNIQCRSIDGKEISFLILSGQYIAVALVDKHKLSRPWLEEICVPGCCGGNSGYTGHYVVICGYDMDTDEFEIRDPASSRKYERVSLECLEKAHKSFGTDEDIILVSLDKKEGEKKLN